jgi:hypothetical protein
MPKYITLSPDPLPRNPMEKIHRLALQRSQVSEDKPTTSAGW